MTTHLSTRLVWHDRASDGHICDYPSKPRFQPKGVLVNERRTTVLKRLRNPHYSDTLLRNPNMFVLSVRPESVDLYLAEHLIHHRIPTANHPNGVLVQSKSRVIVANILNELGLSWDYELKLFNEAIDSTDFRGPHFTVNYQGDTFDWEHRGMLGSPKYKEKWEWKEQWYKDNGYCDQLIMSKDGMDSSIDAAEFQRIARQKTSPRRLNAKG